MGDGLGAWFGDMGIGMLLIEEVQEIQRVGGSRGYM